MVAVLAVVRGASLELLLQIIPLAALLVVYVALIPRTDGPRLLPCIPDLESAVPALATRVVVVLAGVLGIQVYIFGGHSIHLGFTAYLLGLLKAGFWYFAIQTVCPPPVPPCSPTYSHPAGLSHLVVHRYCHRDVRLGSQPRPLDSEIRAGSCVTSCSLASRPRPDHLYASQTIQRQVGSVGAAPPLSCPLLGQHRRYSTSELISPPFCGASDRGPGACRQG